MSHQAQVSEAIARLATRVIRHSAMLVLATTIGIALPARAAAQLNICNKTGESINVAIAYSSRTDAYVSRGWYNAAPGTCVTPVVGSLQKRYYYVFGESSTKTWGRDRAFCTSRNAFEIESHADCSASGFTATTFTRIDTGEETNYTFNLTSGTTPSEATQAEHAVIEALDVYWRKSALNDTWVMQLRNSSSTPVAFTIRCYTNAGQSKSFWAPVPAEGFYEIGFVQGWEGNFVRGEYCDAYHGNERLWRARTPENRAGR